MRGRTAIQVIALFAALAEAGKASGGSAGPHLVVAPASTLANWMNELARWCPSLKARKYHAPLAERKQMQRTLDADGFDVRTERTHVHQHTHMHQHTHQHTHHPHRQPATRHHLRAIITRCVAGARHVLHVL
jgi:hypothetical protein